MRSMLLALLAATAIATSAQAKDVTVAVTAIVEHPALDAARDGVKDALAEAGYKEGENLKFVYQSAQGNPATAAQIARQFVGEGPDVIVPISTPSAQAVVSATRDIPIVFTAVSDPVGAQRQGYGKARRQRNRPFRHVAGGRAYQAHQGSDAEHQEARLSLQFR